MSRNFRLRPLSDSDESKDEKSNLIDRRDFSDIRLTLRQEV